VKADRISPLRPGAMLLALAAAGCASSSPSAPPVASSVYAGAGFYEVWEWGPVYREPPIVVGPPGRPAHPIAPAPRPAPR
jgi:hypothetical protein